jgi:CRISPR system Cascade subunit CasC
MSARFLQLHTLTAYPASLLNRDDAGFAKRLPFGGTTRTRISSQCLKRHWRTFDGEGSLQELAVPESIRSRYTFDQFIFHPLLQGGASPELARAVTEGLMKAVLGQSAKAKKAADKKADAEAGEGAKAKKGDKKAPKKQGDEEGLMTGQITVLGRPEVEFLLAEARAIAAEAKAPDQVEQALAARLTKERKENLAKLRHGAGLSAALFGRMVTSDILARGDAAVHVAHAFTVHEEATESDYFSAVDELKKESEDSLGSGHIGNTELTSGLFYGYTVIDVPLLVSNLEGCERKDWKAADRNLAASLVERLVHLVATVSPGAKLGSTAPYAYAHLLLVEAGNSQPRTLANAFLPSVSQSGDVVANTYAALGQHMADLDRTYGASTQRRLSALGNTQPLLAPLRVEAAMPLRDVAGWAASQVRDA